MGYETEMRELAKQYGVQVEEMGMPFSGHWQIKGKLLVNYYPKSSKRTAYVAGTTAGRKNVTPEEAIKMSLEPPKIAPKELKDERGKNSRSLRRKMLKGRMQCKCNWCDTMIDLDTSTVDHVIPLHRGGLDNANNRVLACRPCNQKRGHDMPEIKESGRSFK